MINSYYLIENESSVQKVYLSEIVYIIYEDYMTTFQLKQTKKYSNKSLKGVEESLPPTFIRINRNCIVNSLAIAEFIKKDRSIILSTGESLTVSYRNVNRLIDLLHEQSINA